jgi:hypothetical protein
MTDIIRDGILQGVSLNGDFMSSTLYKGLLVSNPPNYAEVIQWLGETYQGTDGNFYQEDRKGDQLRDVELGAYLALDGVSGVVDTNTTFNFDQDFTYTRCFRMNGIPALSEYLFSQAINGVDDEAFRGAVFAVTGNLRISYGGTSDIIVEDISSYLDNEFHDLIIQFVKTTNTISLSIDGTTLNSAVYAGTYTGNSATFIESARHNGTNDDYALFLENDMCYSKLELADGTGFEYDVEEIAGGIVLDKSGNENNGEIIGGVTRTESIEVPSYRNTNGYNKRFLGNTGDFITLDSNVSLSGAFEITYDLFPSNVDAASAYVHLGGVASGDKVFHTDTGSMTFRINGTSATAPSDSIDLYKNNRIKLVRDSSNDFFIYVNDVQVATANQSSAFDFNKFYRDEITSNDLEGWMSNIEIIDNGTLIHSYKGYGSSNEDWTDQTASNDGTVTGGEDVYIPRLETAENIAKPITTQTDVFGRALEFYGRVRYDVQVLASNVVKFNGTDNSFSVDKPTSNTFKIKERFAFTEATGWGWLAMGDDANDRLYIGNTTSGGTVTLFNAVGGTGIINESYSAVAFNDGEPHEWELESSSSGTTLKVDGNTIITTATQVDISGITSTDLTIGARFGVSLVDYSNLENFEFELYNGTSLDCELNFAEGCSNTIYDKLENKNIEVVGATGFRTTNDKAEPGNLLKGHNQYMCFDGVNDYVALSSKITFAGDFNISLKFFYINSGVTQEILGESGAGTLDSRFGYSFGSANFFYQPQGVAGVVFFSGVPIVEGVNNISLSRVGTTLTLDVNGVSDSNTFSGTFGFDEIGRRSNNTNYIKGMVYDVDFGISSYQGYGNTDADWTDQIGSNDGTVVGSPELIRIPSSSVNSTQDVFGETLRNKPALEGHNDSENTLIQPSSPELYAVDRSFTIYPWYGSEFGTLYFESSNWTKGTGWSISNGIASCDGTQTATSFLFKFSGIVVTDTYKTVLKISNYQAGSVRIRLGNSATSEGIGTWRSADGEFIETLIGSGTGDVLFLEADSSFIGDIEYISTKDITDQSPVPFPYDIMDTDYEDLHYWFMNIFTRSPIKYNHTVYSSAQTGTTLDKILLFMDDQYLRDEDGKKLLDENDEPILKD